MLFRLASCFSRLGDMEREVVFLPLSNYKPVGLILIYKYANLDPKVREHARHQEKWFNCKSSRANG